MLSTRSRIVNNNGAVGLHRLRPLAVFVGIVVVLCLFGLWGARSQTGALRRVTNTTEEGININPSLSGDGRRIAFESTEDVAHAGGSDFFRAIRADVTSDPPTFVQMGATRAPAAGISQDGSRIAFASKEDPLGTNGDGNSEIFLFDGTALRQITNTTPNDAGTRTRDGNFQPSLTDDGRFIAFSSNRNLASQNGDGNLEILIFDSSSSSFTQLTNTTGAVGASDAKISGDAARVAYIRDVNAVPAVQRDLVLQDRTGGTTRIIAGNVTNLALTYGRAISDDGSRVVFSGDIATDSSQVFLFDGRVSNATRQITALNVRTTEVPLHPTISGDGTRIAFATRRPIASAGSNSDNSIELYTYDIPTGQFARVTTAPSTADGFSGSTRLMEVVSSLNDDGSIVAFNFPRVMSGAVTSGFENNSEIYVTGTTPRPTVGSLTILNEASFGHEPSTTKAISPDSRAVALGGALSFNDIQSHPDENGNYPTTVDGTTVTVNGRRAQIFFVSPTQVKFLVPAQTELGTATVVVTNAEGFQSIGTVSVMRAAPGIYTESGDGLGKATVLNADTGTSGDPGTPGQFDPSSGTLRLVIFTTGVRNATQVTATAGGRALTVESVMKSPDMPGMDEVRVLVPSDLRGAGTVNLVVRADGRDSNPAAVIFSGNSCRDIVINEVLADPPEGLPAGDANRDGARGSSDDEFVELVNTTAIDIDISGYQLLTRSTSSPDTLQHLFPAGTIFPAGSAIVVFGGGGANFDPNNAAFGGAQVFKASEGELSLTNSGGVVTLREASQAIMNIFSYGGSTGLNGDANQSLTRSPDAGPNGCGNFTLHSTVPGSTGPHSPGTKLNGSPFASGQGRLTTINISPPSANVTVGQSTQFTAQARDQFNRAMTSPTITFASDDTNVATVDSVTKDPATGIATATVTGRAQGTAHITATATDGGITVTSSQSTINVFPPPPITSRVEVAPTSATINRGNTQQFSATAFQPNNQPVPNAIFTWTSSNTNIATIDQNGLATGVGVGSVTITATTSDGMGGTVSGTATLNVQVPLVINEILADPPAGIGGDSNRDGVGDTDDDEFVELVNNSTAAVDVSGVILADSASNRFTFPANTTLAAGRGVVIFGGGSPPANDPAFGGSLIFTTGSLGLTNSGDSVTTKLPVGGSDVVIATQTYGAEGGDDQSLTRSPDLTGAFVKHSTATNADGRFFSPGTRVDGTPFGSPPITRIEVTPASAAIDVAGTQIFTARAFSNTGGPEIEVLNVSFIWDSSDATKATVAPATGRTTTATGVAPGSGITIRARAGAQLGSATLTVNSTPPVLTSVTILPLSATINPAQTQQFTGQALDQFSQPIGGVTVTFASNNTPVATVDSVSPTSGTGSATATVTGQSIGSAEIRASATNGSTTVTSAPAVLTVAPIPTPAAVVISQLYGGGGNSGATYTHDFIEIFNRGTTAVDLTGWSVQYASSAGTTWQVTTLSGTIQPGQYYLVQEASNAAVGIPLPTPDATGTIILAATAGKVALVSTITALSGACPSGATIIDLVGYGGAANCFEGAGPAPAPSATAADLRANGGCTDTNNNAADFTAGAPNPRNASSPLNDCNAADLSITKSDSPDPVTTGSDVTYTITVTNNGPGSAQSVVVTDNLPAAVTFVSCSSTGTGVCGGTGNNRTISFSSLASGASATITLVATANGVGGTTITNTATVSSTTTDPNSGNDSATSTTAVQAVAPNISINDISVTEGNSGTTTVDFTVTLSASSTQTVTVAYATSSASPATATAGTDYQSTNGTLTFNPGDTSEPITVTINGDTLVESDETFFVDLSGATNANILDGQGQGTITNDDTPLVVISQLYGGGGNGGATFTHDFIEVFNRGTTTVNLTGWSVQYTAAAGTTWQVTNLSGTLQPGQYYLVQEASTAAIGSPLPTPDATGTIPMAATAGKVALVTTTTALSGACPSGATIMDLVGYGGAANCFEGAGPAPAPSATTADVRANNGCTDTNNNASDFGVATPSPRNTSTPLNDCNAADLSIIKVDSPDPVNAGENIIYTLTVTNNSSTNASQNVIVSDAVPTNTTFVSVGTLPSGWTRTDSTAVGTTGTVSFTKPSVPASEVAVFTITVKVSSGAANNSVISNTATVSSSTTDPNAANNTSTATTTVRTPADLSLSKSVNNSTPNVNGNVIFTVTVSNAGPFAATGVSVKDLLPSGLTYVSDDSGGAYIPGTGIWTVGTINASTSATLHITATATSGTINTVTNTAEVFSSNQFDPDSTPNNNASGEDDQASVTVRALSADLSLSKTVDNSSPNVSDNVVFTIKLSNGGQDPATNVEVKDLLPSGLTYVSDSSGGGYNSATGIWTVGTVSVGANVATLTITANVTTTGVITNTAEVFASDQFDPDSTPNNNVSGEDDQASVNVAAGVAQADLSLSKSVDNSTPNVNSNVVFTITLSNGGPTTATGVSVKDLLPAGLTYVSDDSGGAYNPGTGIWTVGTVNASASATLHITATVTSAAVGGVTNIAEVFASDQADPDSTPNNGLSEDDRASATVTPLNANLSITKTDSPDPVAPGGTLTYTIMVTNGGSNASQNVTVTDNLPSDVTFVSCTSVSGNGTCGGTGNNRTVTFTSIPNGTTETITLQTTASNTVTNGSTISNTATVSSSTTFDPSTPNSATTTTTVNVASADIAVTKTDSPDPVAIGNDITYTITVTNSGPDTAASATFSDTVPTNTTFRSITTPSGWTCGTVPALGGTGAIGCTNPSFSVGSSIFTLVVRVNTSVTDGTVISNTASASSSTFDSNGLNNSATQTTTAKTPLLVISQVYGGGSNSGAAYGSDFVQIFNRGTTTVDFAATPYSVQYASAAGSFLVGNKVDLTTGIIAPGQYFLIKLAPVTPTVGTTFTADVTSTGINMSATDGKVALVLGTTLATTTAGCPTAVTVVDLLGYGSANCAETTATAVLSSTKVAVRNSNGCTDTNSNVADFTVTTVNTSSPVPKNSSSAPSPCP